MITHLLACPVSTLARIRLLAPAAALALSASLATAAPTDWVVDDDGGPGVDFTTLQSAVAAASHGDRIFVHPGSYPHNVTTNKGLTIVGVAPGVSITGLLRWQALSPSRRVRIAGLELQRLVLMNCYGTVLVSEISAAGSLSIQPTNCADLRIRDTGQVPLSALRIIDSHVELSGCVVQGRDGYDGNLADDAEPGEDAIVVDGTSYLFLTDSSAFGGDGGTSIAPGDCSGFGGSAIRVDAGGVLVLAGTSANVFQGGETGSSLTCSRGGHGVSNNGTATITGVTLIGGTGAGPTNVGFGGVFHFPGTDLPFLTLTGTSVIGQTLSFTIHGAPGANAILMVGTTPIQGVWPGSGDPLLVHPRRSFFLGTLDAQGELHHTITLPGHVSPGSSYVFQARVEDGLGVRLTNSAPILVR